MKKIYFLWSLLVFASSFSLAQPETGAASGYFGMRTGYIELEEVDDQGSWNIGIMGGFFLNPMLSIDVSVDFQTSEFVYYYTNVDIEFNTLNRKTVALQTGLTLSPFYNSPFRPYIEGGLGYFYSYYTNEFLGVETIGDGGYYAGFGADFLGDSFQNEGFSICVDARWLFTREEPYLEQTVKSDGRMISIGFKFRF